MFVFFVEFLPIYVYNYSLPKINNKNIDVFRHKSTSTINIRNENETIHMYINNSKNT